ncbi:hypothetical protein [Croceibacterium ferulae]|uniref:hypothetical protein n=1 Tax=Croceibacterium ferulae TaxID=1854641 RepID=UPI000F895698|nr:hypothetical protein [Croceibacterium ferulae]
MAPIMLELRNSMDHRSGEACGVWIEVHQTCSTGRKTDLSFAAGSVHKTADAAALGREVVY